MQGTNRNTIKLYVADARCGKTCASASRLVFKTNRVFLLVGRQGGGRFLNQSLSVEAIAISKCEFIVSRLKWKSLIKSQITVEQRSSPKRLKTCYYSPFHFHWRNFVSSLRVLETVRWFLHLVLQPTNKRFIKRWNSGKLKEEISKLSLAQFAKRWTNEKERTMSRE